MYYLLLYYTLLIVSLPPSEPVPHMSTISFCFVHDDGLRAQKMAWYRVGAQ